MKCIVLAGGMSDSLWPLSRQKYPKQFMPFRKKRSLFQENIVRNMTFCDEFIVVTHKDLEFVVESQMRALQGVSYRIIVEEANRRTAIPTLVAAMAIGSGEDMLVISSDALVDDSFYQNAMIESKKLLDDSKVILHGIKPTRVSTRFSYVLGSESECEFILRPGKEAAEELITRPNCYWSTGIFLANVDTFLKEAKRVCPDVYDIAARVIAASTNRIVIREEFVHNIGEIGIDVAFLSRCSNLYLQKCEYSWNDIGSFRVLDEYLDEADTSNVIKKSSNATVINRASNKLVVVNDLNDAVVVSTDDAIYVSSLENADDIKDIMDANHDKYIDFFDYNTTSIRSWGTHELLKKGNGYKIKKVTVAPGMEFPLHRHEFRHEQWTIVAGTPTITLGDANGELVTRDYNVGESVSVPVGTPHKVRNNTLYDVEIVEIATGHKLADSDVIRLGAHISGEESNRFVKLNPAFKDYLWGGTRLRDELKKDCDYDIIAESWELSAHADGVSRVASGKYAGMYFNDYLEALGRDALGWKAEHYDRFPILIKFIDAKNQLSIQIHPDDEYALKNEGEYGKNEMWYIMDCDEDAFIYYGTKEGVTKEELRERIANNTILEVLNKVHVKKGDVFYVKAGTIHAIGAGILICEIQQSSNSTYRLYDYNRRDKFGNLRELHVDKAIDVVDTSNVYTGEQSFATEVDERDNIKQLLVSCKYFECNKYTIKEGLDLLIDNTSFISIMVVNGAGTISDTTGQSMPFARGDSFFVPAGAGIVSLKGASEIVVTHV